MSNLFKLIQPIALTIPEEDMSLIERLIKMIGVDKDNADLLWLTPLVGIAMVFAVLTILWGVLVVFKLIFARPKKEEKKAEPTPKAEASAPAPAPVPVESTDDVELIAILTAAIVAYESEQNPDVAPCNFRVVSYRRANGGRSWNAK